MASFIQLQKIEPKLRIIDRLGHSKVGTTRHLAMEAIYLLD